jgi:hypothetical protein
MNKNNTILQLYNLLPALLLMGLLVSCGVTRHLPADEKLYAGATILLKTDSLDKKQKKALISSLNSLIRPVPNKNLLGARYKLWWYYKAGSPKNEKSIRGWMKNKLGEPPVYLSMANPKNTRAVLENFLENKGYFYATVSDSLISDSTTGKYLYTVTPANRYTIRNVSFEGDTAGPAGFIQQIAGESLLKSGNPYDFDNIKTERERIDNWLKEKGFYLFNPDYILMKVDTTVGNHLVDIHTVVKKETPRSALRQWYINNIYIYPNYEPAADSIEVDSSYWQKRYYIIDPAKAYKPKVFNRTIFFKPGEVYNRTDHNKTLNRLVNVGTFRFVRNRFEELPPANDSGLLNVYYFLVNAKRRSLRFESTGKTTSANFGGIEFNLNWRNRNTFRAAEQLMLKLYGGTDVQFAGQNKGYNIYRLGTEASITWPRFIPFKISPSGAFVPNTKLTLGYEWQQRQRLYTLNTLKASFGWLWKSSLREEQDFYPLNLTLVNSSNVSEEYLNLIQFDSLLARVIEEQLIIGPSYTYTYTYTIDQKRRNGFYYRSHIDLSGNVLGLLQGANAKNGVVKTLFDVQYSQFFKMEHDLRYYRRLGTGNKQKVWVNRLNIGFGLPYGNSVQLPFIKQFFTGGSNSLRAFRVRSVGPGTYRPPGAAGTFLPDLTGDIKLEMNSELRFPLVSIFQGALFADAGNIWLYNDNPLKPGGRFSSRFLSELAIGIGAGLRLDIAGIFTMRLDLGMPVRKPWLPPSQRWVFNQIDFGNPAWRSENLVLNLAVGMPF